MAALASVRERFSADLKDSVSESDLKDARDELTGVAGAFQAQISQTTRTVQGDSDLCFEEPIRTLQSRIEADV